MDASEGDLEDVASGFVEGGFCILWWRREGGAVGDALDE